MQEFDVVGRIQELCRSRSWTYYRLAKASGIPYSTLSTMLHKTNVPSVPSLMKICDGPSSSPTRPRQRSAPQIKSSALASGTGWTAPARSWPQPICWVWPTARRLSLQKSDSLDNVCPGNFSVQLGLGADILYHGIFGNPPYTAIPVAL